jgi:hypothetical protein
MHNFFFFLTPLPSYLMVGDMNENNVQFQFCKQRKFLTGVVRPVGERKWRGDAMVKVGFKVVLQQFQALAGGQ